MPNLIKSETDIPIKWLKDEQQWFINCRPIGSGRVAELKTKTIAGSDSAKTGRRAVALPSKPDSKHARQVAFCVYVVGCKASLIYSSENGYRVFD